MSFLENFKEKFIYIEISFDFRVYILKFFFWFIFELINYQTHHSHNKKQIYLKKQNKNYISITFFKNNNKNNKKLKYL